MPSTATPKGLICSLALVESASSPGNYQGLKALIARLRPAVAGLLLDPMFWRPDPHYCGPVSAALLEEVIGLIPPHLPLWVRITGNTAEQTIHICQQLETVCRRLRFRGPLAWVDTPLFYHSNRGLPEYYQILLSRTEFCVLLDNDPELLRKVTGKAKRKNIRTAVLKKLSQQPRLAGLLHRGDLRRGMNYQKAVRNRPDFLIYDASERHFLERPSASGVISVGANLLPHDWRIITMASLNPEESGQTRSNRFRLLWEAGQRVRALHKHYRHAPTRIIPAVLAAWGLVQGDGQSLDPTDRKAVERILHHTPEL
jgi:hypothetical protein